MCLNVQGHAQRHITAHGTKNPPKHTGYRGGLLTLTIVNTLLCKCLISISNTQKVCNAALLPKGVHCV